MSVIKSWNGEEKLWKVFWVYGFLGGLLLTVPFLALILFGMFSLNIYLILLAAILYLGFEIWWLYALWQCSENVGWKGWSYVTQSLVILTILSTLIGVVESLIKYINT